MSGRKSRSLSALERNRPAARDGALIIMPSIYGMHPANLDEAEPPVLRSS